MPPAVSVLMSVLNGEKFLRPAIDSVLAQSFADFELIVVDNCSSDGTAAILDGYADPRIVRLRNSEVLSLTQSLNKGLAAACGEYIARLDADDVAAPARLERQLGYLRTRPDTAFVASHVRFIDESGRVIGHDTSPTDSIELHVALAYSNPIAHSAAMFRRQAAAKIGGYPAAYDFAQDYALWLQFAKAGRLGMIEEPLVDLRQHGAQSSLASVYQLTRHHEAIALFKVARQLPRLPSEALRRNSQAQATHHLLLANELLRLHRPAQAVVHIAASFGVAPVHALRKLAVGASRAISPWPPAETEPSANKPTGM